MQMRELQKHQKKNLIQHSSILSNLSIKIPVIISQGFFYIRHMNDYSGLSIWFYDIRTLLMHYFGA